MMLRSVFIGAVVLAAVPTIAPFGTAARAQSPEAREAELVVQHQLCDRGDRKACVRFGMMLGEMRERHEIWRRTHPEFFFWER